MRQAHLAEPDDSGLDQVNPASTCVHWSCTRNARAPPPLPSSLVPQPRGRARLRLPLILRWSTPQPGGGSTWPSPHSVHSSASSAPGSTAASGHSLPNGEGDGSQVATATTHVMVDAGAIAPSIAYQRAMPQDQQTAIQTRRVPGADAGEPAGPQPNRAPVRRVADRRSRALPGPPPTCRSNCSSPTVSDARATSRRRGRRTSWRFRRNPRRPSSTSTLRRRRSGGPSAWRTGRLSA